MIRRLLLYSAMLCAMCLQAYAGGASAPDTISVRRAFVEMPVATLDLLSKSTRLDMIDFYDLDSIYDARNTMAGISRLESMSPGYMKISLTPVTVLELKVLPFGGKGAEMVLSNYTVGDSVQARDSDLKFFDSRMSEIPASRFISLPVLEDFLVSKEKKIREEVERLVPFPTVEYTVSPDNGTLTARLTVGQFMSREDFRSIESYLKPKLDYIWNGRRYEKAR